jgi:hypothetical protein
MRITSSGNVGIGTSSPSSFYSLANNLVVGTGTGGNGLTIYSQNNSSGYIGFNDTASNGMQGFIQYNHSGDYMAFAPNGTEKMRIDSSGQVGIGTTSPAAKLHVSIPAIAAGTDLQKLGVIVSTPFTSGYQSQSSGLLNGYDGALHGTAIGMAYVSPGYALTFFTNNNTSGLPTERMRIDSSGRVTMPYQPAFTGTGLFPSTSGAYVDLNTNIRTTNINHNVGSHFNNSTGVFTCPVAGMYSVFASLLIDDDSGTSELCRASWKKNGSNKFWIYDNQRSVSTSGRYEGMAVTGGLIHCAANDTITLVAVGGAFHAGSESTFSIHLIG